MKVKRPNIILDGIQIKSLGCARRLCQALEVIEEDCGIFETKITCKDPFICPWIDLKKLNRTPTEKLVAGLFKELRKQKYDKK
jgi:hypothetical protein